jgi:hypothetical protein
MRSFFRQHLIFLDNQELLLSQKTNSSIMDRAYNFPDGPSNQASVKDVVENETKLHWAQNVVRVVGAYVVKAVKPDVNFWKDLSRRDKANGCPIVVPKKPKGK